MKNLLLITFLLIVSFSTYSQSLLKNIALSDASSDVTSYLGYSSIYTITKGDSLFFSAKENRQSYSSDILWMTDGSEAGSKRITDLNDYTQKGDHTMLNTYKGRVYYTVNGNLNCSDGNTVTKLKNFGSSNQYVLSAHVIRDTLFLMVSGAYGQNLELWKTDGTAINTQKVSTIVNGSYYYNYVSDKPSIVVDDKLYFSLSGNNLGIELWVCDGTAAGTYMLKDIVAGSGGSNPESFVKVGSQVLFLANNHRLWRTDGTGAGTVEVSSTIAGSSYYWAYELVPFNNQLYFSVYFGTNNVKFYKSDGLTVTEVVSNFEDTKEVSKTDNAIFMITQKGSNYNLWKSDGTSAGTQKIKTVATSPNYLEFRMNSGKTKCYFYTYYYINGNFENIGEHWVSDGTDSGTKKIKELNPTFSVGSQFAPLKTIGDNYCFSAYDDVNGFEVWKSDGTSQGTKLIKNINVAKGGALPKQFVALGNTVFFSADDIKHGRELWTTGGTQNSTQLYADYNNGGGIASVNYDSEITGMTSFNNSIIALIGNSLMKFDTINPPVLIKRLSLVNLSAAEFIKYNNILFYSGWSESEGYELWTTNGITTSLFKDLTPGYSYDRPNSFIVSGGFLYFITGGNKLWKSDGTVAGTVLVKAISGYIQSKFTEANGKLYFTVQENTNGVELWVSDGTDIGTKIVKDIYVGSSGSNPRNLVALNGSLYFSAYSNTGYSVWKTDGTSNNTVKIFNDYTLQIATLKDKLYFVAYDYSARQYALWQSAGTSESVTKIKNLSQNIYAASVLFNVEDKYLVFDILPNETLDELWMTDGTAEETKKIKNIRNMPINSYSASSDFFYHNKKLYFAADDGINGKELWMWDFACFEGYTVRDTLNNDTTITSNKYIVAMNTVQTNAKVNYNTNNNIDLIPGFNAKAGSVFTTSMTGCVNTEPSASLVESPKKRVYQASDLANTDEYQPSISQFLEASENGQLSAIYIQQRQQGNADKIQWIIQTETDRYVLKLSVDNQEYLGYLPKR